MCRLLDFYNRYVRVMTYDQMKIGIIFSNSDPEILWNALRFANTVLLEEHRVKVFLLIGSFSSKK